MRMGAGSDGSDLRRAPTEGGVLKALRAAVLGAGNMGRHHARILGGMDGVELRAVMDPDKERAQVLAGPLGAQAVDDVDALPEVDIAVVAGPTHVHAALGVALLARGVSVLVEKPLAPTPEEAARLVEAADDSGAVLAVGHVERFNPVVALLASMELKPRLMQFERLSPYTPRIRESIVFDLMVHDLDLACLLAGGAPSRVAAAGAVVFSDTLDLASAVLEFPGGCVASLQASRVTQDKIRKIAISEEDRFLQADCLRHDIGIKREVLSEYPTDGAGLYRQASVVEIPYIDRRGEPLRLELEDFVAAVREARPPRVTGRAGAMAVKLAYEVEAAALRPSAS